MNRPAVMFLAFSFAQFATPSHVQFPPMPPEQRGSIEAKRRGMHDSTNLRTEFGNINKVGNYPLDPVNVDFECFIQSRVLFNEHTGLTDLHILGWAVEHV